MQRKEQTYRFFLYFVSSGFFPNQNKTEVWQIGVMAAQRHPLPKVDGIPSSAIFRITESEAEDDAKTIIRRGDRKSVV